MAGKSVIVTGATGLLGSTLVPQLVARGWHVIAIARREQAAIGAHETIPLDFASDWHVNQLPGRVDAVVHLSQSSAFRDFPAGAMDVFRVNIESTARLLDYARQASATRFVYASSGGVYGNGSEAFRENAPIIPPGQLGFYLGSKAAGEILAQSYASLFCVVVLRPFFMYGPGQNRSMLIPRLVDSVREGRVVRVQGEEGIRINPIHVEDSAAATAASLELDRSATFNIAGPEVLSICAICDGIGRHFGSEPVISHDAGQPQDLVADISAMESALHRPVRGLLESLPEMA